MEEGGDRVGKGVMAWIWDRWLAFFWWEGLNVFD